MSLGELIRQQRAALGLTQARLAELVGKSPSTVRGWERDRSRPSNDASLSALAAVLGLSEEQVQRALWAPDGGIAEIGEPTPSLPETRPAPITESVGVELTTGYEPIVESDLAEEEIEVAEPGEVEPAEESVLSEPSSLEAEPPGFDEPPELETVVSDDLFHSPSPEPPARRFRFGELADGFRSAGVVSRRPRVPSYLDDPAEVRTYRMRMIMTAALIVFMIIVLLWAIGEARDAFGLIYDDPAP